MRRPAHPAGLLPSQGSVGCSSCGFSDVLNQKDCPRRRLICPGTDVAGEATYDGPLPKSRGDMSVIFLRKTCSFFVHFGFRSPFEFKGDPEADPVAIGGDASVKRKIPANLGPHVGIGGAVNTGVEAECNIVDKDTCATVESEFLSDFVSCSSAARSPLVTARLGGSGNRQGDVYLAPEAGLREEEIVGLRTPHWGSRASIHPRGSAGLDHREHLTPGPAQDNPGHFRGGSSAG